MDDTGVCGCVSAFGLFGSRGTPPLIFLQPIVREGRKRLTRGEKKALRRNLCVTGLRPDMRGWDLQIPWEGDDFTPCPLKPREVLEIQRSILQVPSQVVALITVPPVEESGSSGVIPKLKELRDKILEDYKETAFRKELWPDHPSA